MTAGPRTATRSTHHKRRTRRPYRPLPFRLVTARGRRSPRWFWPAGTESGELFHLTGLQRAQLLLSVAWIRRGRHRWTYTAMAERLECDVSTVSRNHRRLRSLSLLGGPAATRGRNGGVVVWLPSARAQHRDRLERAVRWPTRANLASPTAVSGRISREGCRRSFRAMYLSDGGHAARRNPRARGRPWPPVYVDERCPARRLDGRLPLVWSTSSGDDVAAVYAGRCPRCRRAHAASLVLVRPDPRGPARIVEQDAPPAIRGHLGGQLRVSPPPPYRGALAARRRSLATEVAAMMPPPADDELRVRYLGWIALPLLEPPIRSPFDGPVEDLAELVELARAEARDDLAKVAASRRPAAPAASMEVDP